MDFYHKHFVGEGDYSYMRIQRVICECTTRLNKLNNIDLCVTIPVLGPWTYVSQLLDTPGYILPIIMKKSQDRNLYNEQH